MSVYCAVELKINPKSVAVLDVSSIVIIFVKRGVEITIVPIREIARLSEIYFQFAPRKITQVFINITLSPASVAGNGTN